MSRRVCHLTYEYPPRLYGGLGRHAGALTAALAGRGWTVDVATVGHRADGATATLGGVRVHRVLGVPVVGDGTDWLAAVAAFDEALLPLADPMAAAADVVHVHDWFAGTTALELQRRHGVPLVVTVHATERGRHQGWLPGALNEFVDAQERRLAAAAIRVVVCSDWMRQFVTRWWDLPSDRITVVPNGVTHRTAGPVGSKADEHTTAPAARAGVLFAGRCEHEKGGHVAVQAVASLHERGIVTDLTIAGEGTQRDGWKRQAHRLGIERHVSFVGRLGDDALDAAYRSTAVVVVPSLYEPFGLVAAEAMAAGAPVVAAATGGLAETVGDGGVLVPADDATALADALAPLVTDVSVREEASRRALRRAGELMSWDAVAAATDDVYDRAIADAGRTLDGDVRTR